MTHNIFTKHSNNNDHVPSLRLTSLQKAASAAAAVGFSPNRVEIADLSSDFSRRAFYLLHSLILLVNAIVHKYVGVFLVFFKRKGKKNHKVCHKWSFWLLPLHDCNYDDF